jgi:hypothetical protein
MEGNVLIESLEEGDAVADQPATVGIRRRPNLPRTKSGNCSDAVTDMSAWLQPAASEHVAHPDADGGRCA